MDWEVREIEKYYMTNKDPKLLYKHVEHMTPQELRDIVSITPHNNYNNFLLYIIVQKKFYPRKKNQRRINERNKI